MQQTDLDSVVNHNSILDNSLDQLTQPAAEPVLFSERLRKKFAITLLGLTPISLLALGARNKDSVRSKSDKQAAVVQVAALETHQETSQVFTQGQVQPETNTSNLQDLVTHTQLSQALRTVVDKVKPSIVQINAKIENEQGSSSSNMGSGVIIKIANKKCIITNAHVVSETDIDNISVRFHDDTMVKPWKILTDKDSDLAVVLLSSSNSSNLQAISFGDTDEISQGDFVVVAGHPMGFDFSFSLGIISALDRHSIYQTDGVPVVEYQDYIQTDATMNPGNSGGPMATLDGKLVGINQFIASNSGGSEGLGFSISIDLVKRVAEDLVKHGKVIRPLMGVALESVRTSSARFPSAVRIKSVGEDSPAEAAGLKAQDIIVSFNGERVHNKNEFKDDIAMQKLGSECEIEVIRNGRLLNLTIKLDKARE